MSSERIIGLGVDIVPVARLREILEKHRERFLTRTFTPDEVARCAGQRREAEKLAARFAAKEAVLKAMGTGLTRGMSMNEIDVVPMESGQPTVRLTGVAAEVAKELGINAWQISLSDCETHAVASVIALRRE